MREYIMDNTEIACLEKILVHLTKIIQLYECEDTEKVVELSNTAINIAAQLNAMKNCYGYDVESEV